MATTEHRWDGVAHSYVPGAELAIDPALALHAGAPTEIDPVTYEVVRYALMNLNLEHSDLVQRLCVSPITMLTRDFQTSLLTEVGDLVFLGPNLQYFSNSHALSIKWMLEHRSADGGIAEGDMLLSNDVFIGAPHQPDTCVAAPVFVDGELFCWVANSMHLADVGGNTPGSFCMSAPDAFQEPLNWPPIKLVEGGALRVEVEDLFVRQSRLPHAVRMDLRAAIGANEATRAKVLALVERHGADVVKAVMRGTLDAGEALFAQRLAKIPDGRWSARGYAEAALPGDRSLYQYAITITKADGRLIVDNAGTDPQAGSINITFAAFSGAVLAALTQQMISDLSGAYGGAYRLVEFRPTPGLLNCASHPAAVSPSGALTTELQLNLAAIATAKMLASGAEELRELILGPCLPHFYGAIVAGLGKDGATPYIFPNTDGMMGGIAGRPTRDGIDVGGLWWIPDGIANNCEDIEAQFPLLVLYRRHLEAGLDGSGAHRGGVGFREALSPLGSPFTQLVLHQSESFSKGAGVFGGSPGSVSTVRVSRANGLHDRFAAGEVPTSIEELGGEVEVPGHKIGPVDLAVGDVCEWVSPSLAGYGDPLERDPALIVADIAELHLDAAIARRVYGVVIAADGTVDADATRTERLVRRRARLGGAEPAEPVAPPAGARRVGERLHVVDGRWWCNGADLGATSENYKERCVVVERVMRALGPEFDHGDADMADRIVVRDYVCPVTGLLIDAEISRGDQPPLHDIALEA